MKKVLVKFNFSDIKHGLIVPNFCVIQGGNVRGGNVPGGNCPGGIVRGGIVQGGNVR